LLINRYRSRKETRFILNTITLAGLYPEEAYELIQDKLPENFNIRFAKSQEELNALEDLEFVILRTLKIDGKLIESNPKLKLIQRWGAGFDTVDIEAAGTMNIPVAVASGVNSCAVAEHAILLMLATYRNLIPLNINTKKGIWDRSTYSSSSYTIDGKRVGLLGLGAIGKMVAKKVSALGADVQYYDIFRLHEEKENELNISYVDFETLLKTSDIISIHLPLTEGTKNLINEEAFKKMKPTSIIINTSRGEIIDENYLAEALRSKLIMGAALDSFSEEPYPSDGILNSIDNLIMTPHIGGTVVDLTRPMVEKVLGNIDRVHKGMPLSKVDFVNSKLCTYPVE